MTSPPASPLRGRLNRECLENLNATDDGDPAGNLFNVLKRGFAALGWAQPSLAADALVDAIYAEQPASLLRGTEMDLKTSEDDESLMRATLLKCYGKDPYAFRVSKEHYLYLAEQIIALREGSRRMAAPPPLRGRELAEAGLRHAEGLTAQLAKPDWKPSRSHVEQARNSIKKLAELISASPTEQPADDRRPDKSRFGICQNCPVTWRCMDNQYCERGIIPAAAPDKKTPKPWIDAEEGDMS